MTDLASSDVTDLACSVVVCARHRPVLLARCLASLARLDHPPYELIVVDSTPEKREFEQLAARCRRPVRS